MGISAVQKTEKTWTALFFLSFGVYLACSILMTTFFAPFFEGTRYEIVVVLCFLLLAAGELLKIRAGQWNTRWLPLLILCLLLAILMVKDAPRKYDAILFVYIWCARDIDFRKTARFTWILSAVLLAVVIGCSMTGIIPDYVTAYSGRVRHYLGFLYALYAPTVLFNVTALCLFEKGRNCRWYVYGILAAANLWVYRMTDARLCTGTALVVVAVSILLKIWPGLPERLKFLNRLFVFSFWIGAALSLGLTLAYQTHRRLARLNSVLKNRLGLGKNSLLEHGVRWFGQRIHWVGSGLSTAGQVSEKTYDYVDSLYIQVLQRYGIIFFVAVLIVLTVVLYRLRKRQAYFLLFLFAVLAGHAVIDDLIFSLHYNTFWLAAGAYLAAGMRTGSTEKKTASEHTAGRGEISGTKKDDRTEVAEEGKYMEQTHLTKEDCGEPISREEARKLQIEMLDALAAFCGEHHLRYFLSGGTLLGAIRHHGFIPWDDDIDVNIPRPDCEKIMELSKGKIGRFDFVGPDMTEFARGCESYRLYDFSTVVESGAGDSLKKHPLYYSIFIDVFPIEGLPTDYEACRKHYRKLVFARKMQRIAGIHHVEHVSLAAHVFHAAFWIPAKIRGYRYWAERVQKIATEIPFEGSEYIGVMTAPKQEISERVHAAEYLTPVAVDFEGKKYAGPSSYDIYLHQLYGNYRELPPEEKRRSHHSFHFYWKKGVKREDA